MLKHDKNSCLVTQVILVCLGRMIPFLSLLETNFFGVAGTCLPIKASTLAVVG